jgi:hypothetical protein
MKIANGIGFELFLLFLLNIKLRQAANSVALEQSMKRRSAQMRNALLQSVQTII